eukprot:gene46075-61607_t
MGVSKSKDKMSDAILGVWTASDWTHLSVLMFAKAEYLPPTSVWNLSVPSPIGTDALCLGLEGLQIFWALFWHADFRWCLRLLIDALSNTSLHHLYWSQAAFVRARVEQLKVDFTTDVRCRSAPTKFPRLEMGTRAGEARRAYRRAHISDVVRSYTQEIGDTVLPIRFSGRSDSQKELHSLDAIHAVLVMARGPESTTGDLGLFSPESSSPGWPGSVGLKSAKGTKTVTEAGDMKKVFPTARGEPEAPGERSVTTVKTRPPRDYIGYVRTTVCTSGLSLVSNNETILAMGVSKSKDKMSDAILG